MTMEFNGKLQDLRKARSLTQEELAEAVFVSRTAVSKWESGRGYPSIGSLKELSIICIAVFIATRQPYAGIICFALLVTKPLMLSKHVR